MLGGAFFVCLFIAAHFRPGWNTLLPASAFVGLWCAFMWAAQGVYITKLSSRYSCSVGQDPFSYLGVFNGVFWGLFNCNQICGNLVSSVVLRAGHSEAKGDTLYCVFLALSFGATLFLCVLPEIKPTDKSSTPKLVDMLASMIQVMQVPSMRYLIPMFIYSGAVFGFICVDFTNVFVRGSLGIHQIGLVMSVFGLWNGMACLLFGRLSDRIGRDPIILYGAVMHFGIFLFFLTWSLKAKAYVTLYIAAALTGTADAAWCTQIYALIGARFTDQIEAAFSTFRMWNSVGMTAAFFLSSRLSWSVKVLLLCGAVILSLTCFVLLRSREKWEGQPWIQKLFRIHLTKTTDVA